MDDLRAALEEKRRLLGELLSIAERQLEWARDDAQREDLEPMQQHMLRRAELIAAVDALDQNTPAHRPDEEWVRSLLGDIKANLLALDKLDAQLRAALGAMMDANSQSMRAAKQTRQGVGAYLGAGAQVGSLYIDQKK